HAVVWVCPPESGGQRHRTSYPMPRGVVPKPVAFKNAFRNVSVSEPPPAASLKNSDAAALLTQEGTPARSHGRITKTLWHYPSGVRLDAVRSPEEVSTPVGVRGFQ